MPNGSKLKDLPWAEEAWSRMVSSFPEEVNYTKRVRPLNLIERMILPQGATGIYWPWRTLALDPALVGPSNIEDLFTHELTHARQRMKEGLLRNIYESLMAPSNYWERPYEREAYEAEEKRRQRRRDIFLPRER